MKFLAKIIGFGGPVMGALIVIKLIEAIWKGFTGEKPPTPANEEEQQRATITKMIIFAVLSGSGSAIIRNLTKRWSKKLERKNK